LLLTRPRHRSQISNQRRRLARAQAVPAFFLPRQERKEESNERNCWEAKKMRRIREQKKRFIKKRIQNGRRRSKKEVKEKKQTVHDHHGSTRSSLRIP
jgi:hypothetical protein